jgi:putative membrane protein (TIGR04086 family)
VTTSSAIFAELSLIDSSVQKRVYLRHRVFGHIFRLAWNGDAMKTHWGRILAGGLFAEVALIVAIVPLGMRLGEAFLHYTAPPGSFVTCFLAALWVARRIESRFILHGILVGVVAALIYVALTRAQPEPGMYIFAHALKLGGGALGGFMAGRRRATLARQESMPTPSY